MWYRILVAALFSLASSSHALANELMLNGLAPYQYLSKTFYVASFYAEQPITSTAQFAADSGAKRMVIKVSADKWSPRQFNQMWKQDIAINNNLRANPDVINLITAFTETPSDDFTRGDTIVIDYAPGQGTRITLNESDWLESGDDLLFRTLANAWLGEIPTSLRFQEAMLAGGAFSEHPTHTQWVNQNDALTIASNRMNLLASFSGESVTARRQAEQRAAEEAERQAAQAELEAQRQRDTARLAEAREQARQLAEARALTEAETAELARAREQASAEARALEQARAQADAERRALELSNAQAAAEAEANAERQAQLQQQVAVYQQDQYRWELLRTIYPRVTYPEWAQQLSKEGRVQAEVVITRSGELVEIASIRPADAGLLGQAFRTAIENAAPFPPVPDAYEGNGDSDRFRATLDYHFQLNQPQAALPARPVPPENYRDLLGELSDEDRQNRLLAYQTRLQAQILSQVEYPYWAENLGQEGLVALRLNISADGKIGSMEFTERSRHAVLNKALEDAVTRASPFESIPPELELPETDLTVQHEFAIN
ncbi:TonB family protein [Saccharospirillum impatiens]|uniref:TonB family protein n=1 Tax=Saccharospirillum impatiens TaxID=169438 RepID=UPI000423A261|nr:TonB family protein [Saccharospirillum impatiens]